MFEYPIEKLVNMVEITGRWRDPLSIHPKNEI